MALSKESTNAIMKEFKLHDSDTGSPEVQIAIFSERIKDLTEHLKKFKKDHNSRKGLFKIISKRRRLLMYLKGKDYPRYKTLIKKLNLKEK